MTAKKKVDPEPSGSGLRLLAIAGAFAAGAAAYTVRWVPLGFCLYVVAVVAASLAPPAEQPADATGAQAQEQGPGRTRRALRPAVRAWLPFGRCGGMWRLSPAGDSCLQESGESRWSPPWTYAALASLCAAVGAVGADVAFTMLLSDVPIVFDPSVSQWVDVTRRALWVAPLSALFGWRLCRGWVWALRRVDAVDVSGAAEAPPETVVVETPLALWGRIFTATSAGVGTAVALACVAALWWAPQLGPFGLAGLASAAGASWLAAFGAKALRPDIEAQRADWKEWVAESLRWPDLWESLPGVGVGRGPKLVEIEDLPDDNKPMIRTYTFQFQAGIEFDAVERLGKKVKALTGTNLCVIERAEPDSAAAREHWGLFTVTVETENFPAPPNPHLAANLPPPVLRACAASAICGAFLELRMETPMVIEVDQVTAWPSDSLVEATLVLCGNVSFQDVAKKSRQLGEKMGCGWVRVDAPDPDTPQVVRLFYGVRGPSEMDQPVRYAEARRGRRDRAEEAAAIDWAHWMRDCRLVGAGSRVPRLRTVSSAPGDLTVLVFGLPDGMDPGAFDEARDKLAQTSGYGFLHPESGPGPREATLTVGRNDPLDETYLFRDYRSQVLKPPRRGHPNPDWYVGVGIDGELVKYEWEAGETPHLLIAGSTGGGKSQIVNSLLTQAIHNNDPRDLQLWLMDQKNELQVFQHFPHVRRFIDGEVTDMSPYVAGMATLEAAAEEMSRRYSLFARHPEHPKKLSEARAIAARSSCPTDAALALPYLLVCIEECADYFKKPSHPKEDVEAWKRLDQAAALLARKARAAGVFIVVITQYPRQENINQVVKTQCRVLGLKAESVTASMVIMDRPGLHLIKAPGRGLLTGRSDPRPFRGLLFDRPDENRPGIEDDLEMALKSIAQDKSEWPKLPAGVAASKWLAEELRLDVEFDEEGRVLPFDRPTVSEYQPDGEPSPREVPSKPEPRPDRPPWMRPASSRAEQPSTERAPAATPPGPGDTADSDDSGPDDGWGDADELEGPDYGDDYDEGYDDSAMGFEDLYRSFKDSRRS
ncbi:MAG: hypothetical protein F4Z31_01680 [Gemmatimonadetes bacterium]|nr:hypothetical protein [Gemmatimonadota bacterium]